MRFDWGDFGAVALSGFKCAWMFDRSLGRVFIILAAILAAIVTLPVAVAMGLLFAVKF